MSGHSIVDRHRKRLAATQAWGTSAIGPRTADGDQLGADRLTWAATALIHENFSLQGNLAPSV